jgi:membrane protein
MKHFFASKKSSATEEGIKMSYCLISAMIVVVTYAILYAICARKTKSNQEFSAIEKGLLKGCLASLGLLVLPIFGNLAFPKLQPQLTAVIFVVELAAIAVYSLLEFRKLNYRKVKLVCIVALFVGIIPVWWQLFSYFQMKHDILNIMDFAMVTFLSWLAAIVVVTFTYLGGPKLRAKKKSKAEAENAKLREQIERMQNERNKLQEDNEKLRSVVQGTKSGTPEQKSVTEDKKAESNPPKNTQTDEAQTTTSAPKSDAEDNKIKVTNPSMTEVQQQKLSEIINQLSSSSSPEDQQKAIEEIVRSYRTATVKEAPAPEEETLSQEPKFVGFGLFFEGEEQEEPEYEEEEEEILDPVDFGDNYEDETIFPDLFTANNLVRAAFAVAIIFVVCVGIRVFA